MNACTRVGHPGGANRPGALQQRGALEVVGIDNHDPMRGVGRTTISGRNYSVWRSGYRVRRGGGWRTFVALGTLGALAIGAYEYYPYAYIEAPEEYCDGLTEDGCQLVFDNVETLEGGSAGQCVAYCPQQ